MRTNSSEYQKKNFLRKSKKMNLMVAVLSALMMLALMTTINANEAYAASAEPSISADSAIVMSASTGETVYSSHELRKMPMADSTKLMTAMIVIDNMHSATEFKNKVQITSATAGGIFKAGESVSVSDLMYAMLMSASNEAANALATYSAGSASAFVSQMNAKAQELGLTNTHYTNPTGVYDEEQYSTAADTAVITQKAFRYSRIKQMSGTVTHKIAGVTVTNTNDLLTGGTGGSLKYSGMYGGIVGHLTEPKTASTYVGIAERRYVAHSGDAGRDRSEQSKGCQGIAGLWIQECHAQGDRQSGQERRQGKDQAWSADTSSCIHGRQGICIYPSGGR